MTANARSPRRGTQIGAVGTRTGGSHEAKWVARLQLLDCGRDRLEARMVFGTDELEEHALGGGEESTGTGCPVQAARAVGRCLRRDRVDAKVHVVAHVDEIQGRLLHADVGLQPKDDGIRAVEPVELGNDFRNDHREVGLGHDGRELVRSVDLLHRVPEPFWVLLSGDDWDLELLGGSHHALAASDDGGKLVNAGAEFFLHVAARAQAGRVR